MRPSDRPAEQAPRVSLPLLENGLDFLAAAVERLSGAPSSRDLKYGVLHLGAGIELLLKARLREHDPAQLYDDPARFDPDDFAAGDFYSANVYATMKRLTNLAGVVIADADRAQILELRRKRNRIEHFGFDDTADAVLAVTASVLGFALDFVSGQLDATSLGPEALEELHGIREALPRFQAFVADRWEIIRDEVKGTSTAVVPCPRCREQAAVADDGLRCVFCGYAAEAEDSADDYAHAVVGGSRYQAVKEGEAWIVSACPSCEREALVDEGPFAAGARWTCFGCGEAWSDGDLAPCDICGEWISVEGGGLTVCRPCFASRVGSD